MYTKKIVFTHVFTYYFTFSAFFLCIDVLFVLSHYILYIVSFDSFSCPSLNVAFLPIALYTLKPHDMIILFALKGMCI